MDAFKEIIIEIFKKGLNLEFKSDAGRINWGTAVIASIITIIYIICQTKIAGFNAQYLHKENPIISFKQAFVPTIIISSACLLLMFIMGFIRIRLEKNVKKIKKAS